MTQADPTAHWQDVYQRKPSDEIGDTVDSYAGMPMGALQEVEDNLSALRLLADEAALREQALAAAREAETLALNRYPAQCAAEVVAVKEVMTTVVTPREVCEDVTVQRQAPVKDPNRIAGTVVGGLAGGLLGSNIGGGSGKTVATVAGAVAGGYAGNQVQKGMQARDTVATTERRCKTVKDQRRQPAGYDVTWRLGDQSGTVRTSSPGRPRLVARITGVSPGRYFNSSSRA